MSTRCIPRIAAELAVIACLSLDAVADTGAPVSTLAQDTTTVWSDRDSATVVTLLRLGATQPDSMVDWVHRSRGRLSPKIASEIGRHAYNAVVNQDFMRVYVWYSTMMVVEATM